MLWPHWTSRLENGWWIDESSVSAIVWSDTGIHSDNVFVASELNMWQGWVYHFGGPKQISTWDPYLKYLSQKQLLIHIKCYSESKPQPC